MQKNKEKCDHKSTIFSHTIIGELANDAEVDVYRCLDCNQLVNVYIPAQL